MKLKRITFLLVIQAKLQILIRIFKNYFISEINKLIFLSFFIPNYFLI